MSRVTETWKRIGKSKKGTYDIYRLEGSDWIQQYRKAGQFGDVIQVTVENAPSTTTQENNNA